MHTGFRGFGSYKRNLLTALLTAFGQGTFMVKDASSLPDYSPRVFRRLVDDGLLIPVSIAAPRRWRITAGVVSAAGLVRSRATDSSAAAEAAARVCGMIHHGILLEDPSVSPSRPGHQMNER